MPSEQKGNFTVTFGQRHQGCQVSCSNIRIHTHTYTHTYTRIHTSTYAHTPVCLSHALSVCLSVCTCVAFYSYDAQVVRESISSHFKNGATAMFSERDLLRRSVCLSVGREREGGCLLLLLSLSLSLSLFSLSLSVHRPNTHTCVHRYIIYICVCVCVCVHSCICR